jgi:hypothetical protein
VNLITREMSGLETDPEWICLRIYLVMINLFCPKSITI